MGLAQQGPGAAWGCGDAPRKQKGGPGLRTRCSEKGNAEGVGGIFFDVCLFPQCYKTIGQSKKKNKKKVQDGREILEQRPRQSTRGVSGESPARGVRGKGPSAIRPDDGLPAWSPRRERRPPHAGTLAPGPDCVRPVEPQRLTEPEFRGRRGRPGGTRLPAQRLREGAHSPSPGLSERRPRKFRSAADALGHALLHHGSERRDTVPRGANVAHSSGDRGLRLHTALGPSRSQRGSRASLLLAPG